MLRIVVSRGAETAKDYFTSGLSREDYEAEGVTMDAGLWGGKGAARLGLGGSVDRSTFSRLCENLHPDAGTRLTPRTKETRRVGYDMNFHAPKSVSILYALTGNTALRDAFTQAVTDTMTLLESDAKTRVRLHDAQDDRTTGNLTWATFVHETSRPVGGIPDPHLHAHCFVFNQTFDEVENRWKAAQLGDIKRDAGLYEAAFHSRLAELVGSLGYEVERRGRFWEIATLSRDLIEKFSSRTKQIEEIALEKGITSAIEKALLGAKTRNSKQDALPWAEVLRDWQLRLSAADRKLLHGPPNPNPPRNPGHAREAVDFALRTTLERSSVVRESEVIEQALRRGVGQTTLAAIRKELDRPDVIRRTIGGERVITTLEVLSEEGAVIAYAREGRGKFSPLASLPRPRNLKRLSEEQKRTVGHVLSSKDAVTLVRGVAGTGKTTIMTEAIGALRAEGLHVTVLSPSASASRGTLREEGFDNADTVAKFLVDPRNFLEKKGGVVWVDEAGRLGMHAMKQLFDVAKSFDTRIIFSGDYKQHGSVERGDALRILESHAGLRSAELTEIMRQKGLYKSAIEALSRGEIRDGFSRLDALGAIHELPDAKRRYEAAAKSFLEAKENGLSALVIAPTHAEGKAVTDVIRSRMKERKALRPGRKYEILKSRSLTIAERGYAGCYRPGDIVQFHARLGKFRAGDRATVMAVEAVKGKVLLDKGIFGTLLPLHNPSRFDVFEPHDIEISRGDVIRITRNGRTKNGKSRVENGSIHRVSSLSSFGDIRLEDGRKLPKDFAHVDHGYCVTSHFAQGRTVDRIIITQSQKSGRAASDAQFYVSASRGRKEVILFTDDKEHLLSSVQRSSERMSATDMVYRDHVAREARQDREAQHERER